MKAPKPGPTATARALPVPHTELSPEALRGVVEAFVLREGTDYGRTDTAHETKVRQVLAQIQRGDAHIVFDPDSGSTEIVTSGSLGRLP